MFMLLPRSSLCSTDLKPGSPGYHAQNTVIANPPECQVPCHCCYIILAKAALIQCGGGLDSPSWWAAWHMYKEEKNL